MVRLPRHENTHLAGADPPPHPCTSSDDAITLWPKWRGASRSELEAHQAAAAVWSGGGGGGEREPASPTGFDLSSGARLLLRRSAAEARG